MSTWTSFLQLRLSQPKMQVLLHPGLQGPCHIDFQLCLDAYIDSSRWYAPSKYARVLGLITLGYIGLRISGVAVNLPLLSSQASVSNFN